MRPSKSASSSSTPPQSAPHRNTRRQRRPSTSLALRGLTFLLVLGFCAAVIWALAREMRRETRILKESLSGLAIVDKTLPRRGLVDIARTDRLALLLVDPSNGELRALRFISPLVPPVAFQIGRGDALQAFSPNIRYRLVAITDKDGEIFRPTPGEAYGLLDEALPLGTEAINLKLDQPFRGGLWNTGFAPELTARTNKERTGATTAGAEDYAISGSVSIAEALREETQATDRLIVLLFDPQQGRPVAFRILPGQPFPRLFHIAVPPQENLSENNAAPLPKVRRYSLRILTDRDNNPFRAAPGELIGRSATLIPLGTHKLHFVLDRPYRPGEGSLGN